MDASVFLSEEARVIHAAKGAPRRRRNRGRTAAKTGKRPAKPLVRPVKQQRPKAKPKQERPKVKPQNAGVKASSKLLAKQKMRRAKVCPKKHPLKTYTGDVDGYSCNLCSEMCDQVYGCRKCDWDACEDCLKKKAGGSPAPGKKDDPLCWDFLKGKCKRSSCKWKHPEGGDWGGPSSRPPVSGPSFPRGGRFGLAGGPPQNSNSGMPYNPYRNAFAPSRNDSYSRGGSLFNGFSGGSSSNSRAGVQSIKKDVSCPVCWRKFYSVDDLEQHQEMKMHYTPDTLKRLKEVWNERGRNRPRDDNSKDQDWGVWEKHGTGFGSKMLKKWGSGDRLGKTKPGPINPVAMNMRRSNFGLGFAGAKKRKRMKDDPDCHQIIMNGNRGNNRNKRWKKTHADGSSGMGGMTSKSKKTGAGKKKKKKRPSKGEKGYELCWNFTQGDCRNGSKCKWKHS